jgi:hypothetical protein
MAEVAKEYKEQEWKEGDAGSGATAQVIKDPEEAS